MINLNYNINTNFDPKIDINKSGHLIAFTNSRSIKNSFLNFIDKIILQNQIYKRLFSLKKIAK